MLADATTTRAAAERAQAIVAGLELPGRRWRDAITARLRGARRRAPRSRSARRRCAEDSEAASFAGQQETYLHVRGAEEVLRRVRDCWGSFFSERALFYRAKKGSLEDLDMAVVVQRMVAADVAGVLFTIDPTRGRKDRMVVEAVFGLGEAVVSGQVTPDHYVLARDGRVKRVNLTTQPHEVVRHEDGGVHERAARRGGRRRAHARATSSSPRWPAIGRDLQERMGVPQDIEWAIEGGELFVLQARPVTA